MSDYGLIAFTVEVRGERRRLEPRGREAEGMERAPR